MIIPVSKDLATSRGLVEVWIEETMALDFDLSGQDQYVDTGAVEGQIQVDFELSRSELMDRLDRAESPSVMDKVNQFLENWSAEEMNTDVVQLDYGRVMLRGAEPTELSSELQLGSSFQMDELRSTSPEALQRKLRRERSYEMTYDDLANDVAAYLEREGIAGADIDFSAPVHIQATAMPGEGGTDFTLTLENNEVSGIREVTIEVDMPPEVGRELEIGHSTDYDHASSWDSQRAVSGTYDPEKEAYVFDVNSLSPVGDEGSKREIRFHAPARAQETLDTVTGLATFTRNKPFSNINPDAVFDAGGHRLDEELGKVNATGHVEATFGTPTEAITIGETAKVEKRFQIEGVTPQRAFEEIEATFMDRGIDGAVSNSPEEVRDIREGKKKYQGNIRGGSVIVGDTRVSVDLKVEGEIRASDRQTSREDEENLPAERRSVTTEYGNTGVVINGRGADQQVVDDYVTDLRNELQVSLESISEAM